MSLPFRLYFASGCPHCESAIEFLTSKQIVFQRIDITGDPIASKGIKLVLGTDIVPVLISFTSKECLKGFSADEYVRVVENYRALGRTSQSDVDSGTKPDTELATQSSQAGSAS